MPLCPGKPNSIFKQSQSTVMNGKLLFASNAKHLQKVLTQINLSQNMAYSQMILGETNQRKLLDAGTKVREAIKLLLEIS